MQVAARSEPPHDEQTALTRLAGPGGSYAELREALETVARLRLAAAVAPLVERLAAWSEAAQAGDPRTRDLQFTAVRALARAGGPAAVAAGLAGAGGDALLAEWAALCLGEEGHEEAVPGLLRLVRREGAEPLHRIRAAAMLADRFGHQEGLGAFAADRARPRRRGSKRLSPPSSRSGRRGATRRMAGGCWRRSRPGR